MKIDMNALLQAGLNFDGLIVPGIISIVVLLLLLFGLAILIAAIAKEVRGKKCPKCGSKMAKFYGDHKIPYFYKCKACRIWVEGEEVFDEK
jgi:hypothetical protein